MGLVNLFKNIWFLSGRSLENPSTTLQDPAPWLVETLGGGKSDSGVSVNSRTVMSYAPVWRAVNLISSDIGKLPLTVYKKAGEGKEPAREHPAYRLLKYRPNPYMTAFTFKRTLAYRALWGNGYALIMRDRLGKPKELYLLPDQETYPVRENGRTWIVTKISGKLKKFNPRNVLHLKGLGNGTEGQSVISNAKNSIGLGLAAEQYGSEFFKNGAGYGVVLEYPQRLTQEAKDRLVKSWNKIHQGLGNTHKTAILEEGMKASPVSMNHDDAQFLQTRQHQVRDVANWFGVPAYKLGDDIKSSYKSLEQESQDYLNEALDPWLVNLEQECWLKLLGDGEQRDETHTIEFKRQALLRADMRSRYSSYQIAIKNGIMSPNEVRAKENMNPYDGGDDFIIAKSNSSPTEAKQKALDDVFNRMTRRIAIQADKANDKNKMNEFINHNLRKDHYLPVKEAFAPILAIVGADRDEVTDTFFDKAAELLLAGEGLDGLPAEMVKGVL